MTDEISENQSMVRTVVQPMKLATFDSLAAFEGLTSNKKVIDRFQEAAQQRIPQSHSPSWRACNYATCSWAASWKHVEPKHGLLFHHHPVV